MKDVADMEEVAATSPDDDSAADPTPVPPTREDGGPSVVVVGGGLAGLVAALLLAEAGISVTLLEAHSHLGGKAVGFVDSATGRAQEHSMRVYMGCYVTLLGILRRLQAGDGNGNARAKFRPVNMEYLTSPSSSSMDLGGLAHHYDIAGELLNTSWALLRSRFGGDLRSIDMEEWFTQYGIGRKGIDFACAVMGVWTGAKPRSRASTILDSMFIVLLSMLKSREASTWTEKMFKMAAFGNPYAENQLYSAFPTNEATIEPLRRSLVELGVDIRLGTRVTGMHFGSGAQSTISGLHVVSSETGERLPMVRGDGFILATDVGGIQRLCPMISVRAGAEEHGEWSVGCSFHCDNLEKLPPFIGSSTSLKMVLDSPWHIVYTVVLRDGFIGDEKPTTSGTIFATASNFEETAGRLFGKPGLYCTPHELKLEYLEQLGILGDVAEELAHNGDVGLGVNFLSRAELEAAPWRYEGCTLGPELDSSGNRWVAHALLYIETKSSPDVGTTVPGCENLFLAGEYISSRYTRIKVPTMEKSAETGVLAAKAAIEWLRGKSPE